MLLSAVVTVESFEHVLTVCNFGSSETLCHDWHSKSLKEICNLWSWSCRCLLNLGIGVPGGGPWDSKFVPLSPPFLDSSSGAPENHRQVLEGWSPLPTCSHHLRPQLYPGPLHGGMGWGQDFSSPVVRAPVQQEKSSFTSDAGNFNTRALLLSLFL